MKITITSLGKYLYFNKNSITYEQKAKTQPDKKNCMHENFDTHACR